MTTELKVPPHSAEAEKSLLGALLLDNELWERVGDLISGKDFYLGRHRRIYDEIERLIATEQTADMVTVSEALGDDLEKAGGAVYLAQLATNSVGALNIRKYAQLVKQKAMLRSAIRVCMEVSELAWNGMADPDV